MKIWVGYASSHSTYCSIIGAFTSADLAVETYHVLRIIHEAAAAGLSPAEVAEPFTSMNLADPVATLVQGQQIVSAIAYGHWPGFDVYFGSMDWMGEPRPTVGVKFLPEFSDLASRRAMLDTVVVPLESLLRRLGAMRIAYSIGGDNYWPLFDTASPGGLDEGEYGVRL